MYTLTTLNNNKLSILTINAIVFSFCLMTPTILNDWILPFPLLFLIENIFNVVQYFEMPATLLIFIIWIRNLNKYNNTHASTLNILDIKPYLDYQGNHALATD